MKTTNHISRTIGFSIVVLLSFVCNFKPLCQDIRKGKARFIEHRKYHLDLRVNI